MAAARPRLNVRDRQAGRCPGRLEPVGDSVGGAAHVIVGHVQLQARQARRRRERAQQRLLAHEDPQVVVLVGLAGDAEALRPGGRERLVAPGAEDDAEAERQEALLRFEPDIDAGHGASVMEAAIFEKTGASVAARVGVVPNVRT